VPEIIAALATAVQTRQPVTLTPTEAARLVGHVNRLTTLLSAALRGDDVSADIACATLRDSIPATQRIRHAVRGAGLRYNDGVARIEWDDGTVTLGWVEDCEDVS
jgi:hypothetical protein